MRDPLFGINPFASYAFLPAAQQVLRNPLAAYFGNYQMGGAPLSPFGGFGLGATQGSSLFGPPPTQPAPAPVPTAPPQPAPAAPTTSQTTAPAIPPAAATAPPAAPQTSLTTSAAQPTAGVAAPSAPGAQAAGAQQGYWAIPPGGGAPVWAPGIPAPGTSYYTGTQQSGPMMFIPGGGFGGVGGGEAGAGGGATGGGGAGGGRGGTGGSSMGDIGQPGGTGGTMGDIFR